jgi:monoterpene epsilon-lactone hydrolase
MSIQAKILNFMLKKYIKKVQPPVEERSYIEARKMMNQEGYSDQDASWGSKILQKLIFNKVSSHITVNQIYLNSIRTLHFTHKNIQNEKCILYFHGGGYVAGSPETHQNMLMSLVQLSSIQIFAIDYSLSPENSFPRAINDAINSYNALLEKGFKSKNIFFGGDSAGGNLSLVSTLKLQELNQELPSKLFLLSPWTDLTGEGRSIRENSKSDPYLSYDNWLNTSLSMQKTVKEWYAPNQNYKNPLISPVFAKYSNFPKTLIQVSDIEILYSDSQDVASKINEGSNEVNLSIYKNLPHVWQIFGFLPEAKKALKEISEFLLS